MGKGYTTYADKMEAKGVKIPALPNRAEGQYMTAKGLHYSDGSMVPVIPDSTKVGAEAEKEDYYTTIPNGPSFQWGWTLIIKSRPPYPK